MPKELPQELPNDHGHRARAAHRAFTYDGLPDAALNGEDGISIRGVTLAGSAEPCARIMLRVCTATGPALVFGSTHACRYDAALVNAPPPMRSTSTIAANTLAASFGADPAGPFALADAMPVSGGDSWAAYVAASRPNGIARAVQLPPLRQGWHPTATLGIFGATAAASRLPRLTQDQTAPRSHRGFVFVRPQGQLRHHDQRCMWVTAPATA